MFHSHFLFPPYSHITHPYTRSDWLNVHCAHCHTNTKSHTNTEKNKLQNIHSHIQIDGHTHFEWEWGHLLGLNQSWTENTTPIPDYNSCTQLTKFYVHHLLSSQSSWSMSFSRNLPLSRPAISKHNEKMLHHYKSGDL